MFFGDFLLAQDSIEHAAAGRCYMTRTVFIVLHFLGLYDFTLPIDVARSTPQSKSPEPSVDLAKGIQLP